MSPTLVPTITELGVEMEQTIARWQRLLDVGDDHAVDVATDELFTLCAAIQQLPAQNMEHVRIKAAALRWMLDDPVNPNDTKALLCLQLIAAIIDGGDAMNHATRSEGTCVILGGAVDLLSSMPIWDLYRALNMAVTAKQAFDVRWEPDLPLRAWAERMSDTLEYQRQAIVAQLMQRTGRAPEEIEQRRAALFNREPSGSSSIITA